MNSKIGSLTGETDLHYSKDRIYPHWFCYAMRERAPYKELINKWFELFDSIHFLGKTFFFSFLRTLRIAEFGLYEKWTDLTKQDFYQWRFAMKESGFQVCL